MSINAFMPQGSTVAIVSAVTATSPVQVTNLTYSAATGVTAQGPSNYSFVNVGAVPVFVSWGTSQGGSAGCPTPVIPTGGSPTNTFIIPVGNDKWVMTLAPNAWFSIIATATSSTLYITPGDGL